MKPLLSWSMISKAFFKSPADLLDRPTVAKKALCLKESAAVWEIQEPVKGTL